MLEAMLSHASEAVKQGMEPIVPEERMVKVLSRNTSFSVDKSFTSIDTDSPAPPKLVARVKPLTPFPPLLTITSDSPVATLPFRRLPST
ncbi:hypothetical protein M407DRAFT_247230, partial [Tulasnella calospora MUT 4182]